MRLITYYYLGVGLIFYSLGLLTLYEGARSGVFARLINLEILLPLAGLIIALASTLWGIAVLIMGINDLMEGEENG